MMTLCGHPFYCASSTSMFRIFYQCLCFGSILNTPFNGCLIFDEMFGYFKIIPWKKMHGHGCSKLITLRCGTEMSFAFGIGHPCLMLTARSHRHNAFNRLNGIFSLRFTRLGTDSTGKETMCLARYCSDFALV